MRILLVEDDFMLAKTIKNALEDEGNVVDAVTDCEDCETALATTKFEIVVLDINLPKKSGLEILPTGYMLIDCGNATTASYISQTLPIPHNKPEIAAVTAMAGEMLGLQCMYLDGGSGAIQPVSAEMISAVRKAVATPLIVGGGIRDEEAADQAFRAGADLIVIGTAFEEEPEVLFALADLKERFK